MGKQPHFNSITLKSLLPTAIGRSRYSQKVTTHFARAFYSIALKEKASPTFGVGDAGKKGVFCVFYCHS